MERFSAHPERRPTVVTGASSGIGQATARALAGAGHPVALGGRRIDRLEETAAQIRDAGGEAYPIALDLADPASVEAFVKAAVELVGQIDVVVCAAGQFLPDSATASSPGNFETVVEVNLLGSHRLVSALLPAMVEKRHGDVVFVTSEVVRSPRVRAGSYVASKWGLTGFARTLQMELEGTGVRASIVQPGQTVTEMGSGWDPQVTTEILDEWIRWGVARHHHFLHPDTVAAAVRMVVDTPAGAHLTLVEVQPEAPIRRRRKLEKGEP
jgi:NADP-dependent 3-hydroxy acid dehydrogenase YdfG